jgi:hypothetical protein
VGGGVHTGFTRHVSHFWPTVRAWGDCEDEEFGEMKSVRGNLSSRRRPAPAPLCPPQIPLDQTWSRTRTAAVGSQGITAWAMARPKSLVPLVVLILFSIFLLVCHSVIHVCVSISFILFLVSLFNTTRKSVFYLLYLPHILFEWFSSSLL